MPHAPSPRTIICLQVIRKNSLWLVVFLGGVLVALGLSNFWNWSVFWSTTPNIRWKQKYDVVWFISPSWQYCQFSEKSRKICYFTPKGGCGRQGFPSSENSKIAQRPLEWPISWEKHAGAHFWALSVFSEHPIAPKAHIPENGAFFQVFALNANCFKFKRGFKKR